MLNIFIFLPLFLRRNKFHFNFVLLKKHQNSRLHNKPANKQKEKQLLQKTAVTFYHSQSARIYTTRNNSQQEQRLR